MDAVSSELTTDKERLHREHNNGAPLSTGDNGHNGSASSQQYEKPNPTSPPNPPEVEVKKNRHRFTRRITANRVNIPVVLEPLVTVHRTMHPKADFTGVVKAYEVAEKQHQGQVRKSGDPYITHPIAVALILAEFGMDTTTIIAALLHDTVEDTGYSLEQVEANFGPEVRHLVDGVTKLDKVVLGKAAEAETIRKMITAMARDPRVLVIKVADRLHNMRTMHFLPPEKQAKKAKETIEVIAPLAHRLGMASIKWELEDLAFAILHPKRYNEIVRLVADRAPSREVSLAKIVQEINAALDAARISAKVMSRPKHYWSIYQKMIVKEREFDAIHDLIGIRIICDSVRDCYAAVGVVHSIWQPMAGRFKDYIAQPRFGVYQSLHTTVVGAGGKHLEVQIRTEEMHQTAEYGIAAHWRYKENRGKHNPDSTEIEDLAWMRQLLDWQREAADPDEFLESLRYDLASKEIFVFTPKGKVITLPVGATPVDFAYSVHTEVGHRCIGAKVNGRLVALETKLDNGAVVEIFTSNATMASPSRDWQQFVVSARARTKIRQWFAKERREEAIESGKEAITKEIRRVGLPLQKLINGGSMNAVVLELRYEDVTALYRAVGEGQISAGRVVNGIVNHMGGMDEAAEEIAERTVSTNMSKPTSTSSTDSGILVEGEPGVMVKLAKCCTPIPRDPIVGFVTRGEGISIHRKDCTNIAHLMEQPERIVEVSWKPTPNSVFLVAVQVEALDRPRLLSDITKVLADEKVNICSASLHTSNDRVAISKFSFEMGDPKHLGHVLAIVRQVEGVFDVYRVNSAA